ncbi:MAG: DUF3540 domain-containing protein [Pseudomonadota bacterium]
MNKAIILNGAVETAPLRLSTGRVLTRDGERYHAVTEAGKVLQAVKADGCLLAPEPGDVVLLTEGGREAAYILSVLVKKSTGSRLILKGTAEIEADSILLKGRQRATMEAPEVILTGVRGEARFHAFHFLTGHCRAEIKKMSAAVLHLDAVMDRVTQRIRSSFKWIEDLEQTRAGRIRAIVKERFSVKAKHTAVTADEDVTIDGKKINLG